MASTGVFVLVVCSLKRSISGDERQQSMILVSLTCTQTLSSQLFDLDIENPLGGGTLAKF
jgi:hypothetical protein